MRTSSAQLKFDDFDIDFRPDTRPFGSVTEDAAARRVDASIARATALNVPDFGARGPMYAVASRLAGRINAAGISEAEHKELLQKRQLLLDKKLGGTISRKEANQLEYVRWSLDRIEDARNGAALDKLEDAVSLYERFVSDVQAFNEQLVQQTRRRK
jgi:hypothetical protein